MPQDSVAVSILPKVERKYEGFGPAISLTLQPTDVSLVHLCDWYTGWWVFQVFASRFRRSDRPVRSMRSMRSILCARLQHGRTVLGKNVSSLLHHHTHHTVATRNLSCSVVHSFKYKSNESKIHFVAARFRIVEMSSRCCLYECSLTHE